MSFTGTLDKCKACDKTVYVVDMLSIEGVPYHKSCFKCSHCKGTLVMSNYSSMDGVLYCKTHFEQLFKESGNFSKNFQTGRSNKTFCLSFEEHMKLFNRTPSKLSSLFSGTQDKCSVCQKTVYPLEKLFMEKGNYSHVLKSANHKRTASSSTPPPEPADDSNNTDDPADASKENTEEQS
ncbi:pollen-specific protein SF3-like [Tripterygium wilfordii]|uniref:Pollen-specific protein SF3-like n=1 Tax=Tripterygium wilfordii TaxID=458696 RepID=A0A7J7CG62_TRIWF|nr:pollen-specific protein SF3-like [Tripterygium wilfordii]